ncbi:MAG: hypothetical protein HZA53_08395 [Planctomycetes bacterium]|nr:hypothetical protein [Planctomycetota bacterium]
MAVSDDDTRAFVAAGAAITVLDTQIVEENVRPQVIHRLELPDCQPVSMLFHHPAGTIQRRLYIAGGTTGLWEVPICASLFASPPIECASSFYGSPYNAPRLVEEIVSSQHHRKRCVDVCVVEGNSAAGVPLLFALFAALAEGPFPATELHAYEILPTGNTVQLPNGQYVPNDTVPYGVPLSFGTGLQGPYSKFASGTALASDPGDPDHLYVALGKGGLVRVTIGAGGALSADSLPRPACPNPQRCPCAPSTTNCASPGESVRDLAVARTPTRAFLYAAFEYNGLVEYDILQQQAPSGWLYATLPGGSQPLGYSERVTAMTDGGQTVFIALANQGSSYVLPYSRAPFRNTGLWSDLCVASGVLDQNYDTALAQGGNDGARTQYSGANTVYWFDRDALDATFRPTQRMAHDYDPLWGTLYMHRAGECDFRLYECTDHGGTIVRQLHIPEQIGAFDPNDHLGSYVPEPDTWNVSAAHLDRVFSASDGVVSLVNPGLLFFGLDGPSVKAEPEASMFFITPPPNEDVLPVVGTLGTASPVPTIQPNGISPTGYEDPPNPFVGSLLNAAHWIDPNDPLREWFIPGDRVLQKFLPIPWPSSAVPAGNCADPSVVAWQLAPIPGSLRSRIGWRPTSMRRLTLPSTQPVPTAADLAPNLKWSQVVSPTFVQTDRSATSPYISSDVVFGANGQPVLVVGVRGGTDLGLKLFMATEFMSILDGSVCGQPAPAGVGTAGIGEAFTQGTSLGTSPGPPFGGAFPEFREAVTHFELEGPGPGLAPCVQYSKCDSLGFPASPVARRNSRCAVFTATDLAGAGRRACIVASGFIVTPTDPPPSSPPQSVSCQWSPYYGRALLSIYDLEDAAAYAENPVAGIPLPEPQLLRVCVGPPVTTEGETHAWAVCVKDYPGTAGAPDRRYAFVGDLLGKLLVYDISGGAAGSNKLYPPADSAFPYLPAGPPFPVNSPPLLEPVVTLPFPKDADDGLGVNCVDLELDYANNILYCATGRSGVAIVDVSNPLNPSHIATLDTPGMAIGLTTWTTAGSQRRLLVGDSLCGLRVYSY